eukprot:TRINITY_DN3823_c0_g1_i1.p2 TRINITY_DN3823_c0_g1~~TRINITY_DN3823_c0_g1_i1.p2  ORF type:complete len:360 (-),score=91.54 TRINITY_DN3823_c0_g1_i1:1263-2342(-)
MSQTDEIRGERLLLVNDVQVHKIVGPEKELLCQGVFEVIVVPQGAEDGSDICFFNIDNLQAPISNEIPCLKMDKGQYVFPMPDSIFYGITFPSNAAQADLDLFEKVLENYSSFRKAPKAEESAVVPAQPSTTVGVMATTGAALEWTGSMIATTLVKSANVVGKGISTSGSYLKSKINPKAEPVKVPESVKSKLQQTKKFSSMTVNVSSTIVKGISDMTVALAQTIATEVSKTNIGQKMSPGISSPTVMAAKDLGRSTVTAVVNVYEGLYDAGEILLVSTANTAADVVEHRYGEEVGDATRDGAAAVVNTTKTVRNVAKLGPKTIAKSTAKTTAKTLVLDDHSAKEAEPETDDVIIAPLS